MKQRKGDKQNANKVRRQHFEHLTRHHIDALWRTAFRMTGCPDAADDLAQETCLKAYIAFDQYEVGSNYKAWIFRILTNQCRDHLRRVKRSPITAWNNVAVDAKVSCDREEKNRPDLQLQQRQLYTDAVSAMDKLSPDIRLVVCLAVLEDLSYQEIAVAADIPVGTVRSRLSSGRKRLKELMKVHAVDSEARKQSKKSSENKQGAFRKKPMLLHRNRSAELNGKQ